MAEKERVQEVAEQYESVCREIFERCPCRCRCRYRHGHACLLPLAAAARTLGAFGTLRALLPM
jgi:hypothetical protein